MPVNIENHIQQRFFEHVSYRSCAPLQRLGEDRLGVEQLGGHAGVLAALTGEQPRRLGFLPGFTADQAGGRTVIRERAEQFDGGFS